MLLTLGGARLSEMDRKAKGRRRKMETRLVRLEPHIAPACVYASEGGRNMLKLIHRKNYECCPVSLFIVRS